MTTIGDDVAVEETTVPSTIEGDDFAIPIRIHLPPARDENDDAPPIRAAVFFIHGGIFYYGSRDCHPTVARGLAGLGLAVVTASFRQGEEGESRRTNVTTSDLGDVIDFVRGRWSDVSLGLVGSSSGGFFALALSQTLGPSAISFCVAICPVANPLERASYLRSCIAGNAKSDGYVNFHHPEKAADILRKQMVYWEDDESMARAGEFLGTKQRDVPTLLIVGSADKNVPFSVTKDVQSW
eukprot:CAMPEP_0172575728 /NCGR_PEP_ID=MMETSP1067-20121228/137359_1 /TAXON_ID=265564 ORGANISM="Thalassiosira punctigera, Strain Tpunct2005C2" /NCGR_SAMPLE_ID=MMETSP1067 /ASSEMBLY_ACC=CAM_ASM_000444 /LENGTH=238 /DNA_ID=CAMNT_0013368379 /DNA_START=21 /DNA_END=734 /DNA_ORIENTATION=+